MKKSRLILLAAGAAACGLVFLMACSGVSPLATVDGGRAELPLIGLPDFSGSYPVDMVDHNCFDYGGAFFVVTQKGNKITVDLIDRGTSGFSIIQCGGLPTGTIDARGKFTVTAQSSPTTTPLVITGTIDFKTKTVMAVATCQYGYTDTFATGSTINGGFSHCDNYW